MVNSNRINPSLDDARARIARASKHIATLKNQIAKLPAEKESGITVTPGITGSFLRTCSLQRVPSLFSILIGETIYNLRAALDYLIYELSFLDSGKVADRTQFPLESTEAGWNDHIESWLGSLNAIHQTAIKTYQPFTGVKWTAKLRDLSNPDKHRHLVIAAQSMKITVAASVSIKAHAKGSTLGKPVNMQSHAARTILFQDRTFVAETLEILQQEVGNVILAFDPDFK